MKFKTVQGFFVFMEDNGTIGIEQYSREFGKHIHVYLTLDQFDKLETWVLRNREEIELVWNNGVEE